MAVPEAAAYLPAAQLVQVASPEDEYLPVTHDMQLIVPVARLMVYLPAGQLVHSSKGFTDILPAAQAVQTDAPALE